MMSIKKNPTIITDPVNSIHGSKKYLLSWKKLNVRLCFNKIIRVKIVRFSVNDLFKFRFSLGLISSSLH